MRFFFNLFALAGALVAILAVAVAAYFAMVTAGWLAPWPALEDVHANVLGAASALWQAAKSLATASMAALQGAGMSPPVQFALVLAGTSLLVLLVWRVLRPRKPVADPAAPAPAAAAPTAPRTNVVQVTDVTLERPRWWWSAKRKRVWDLAVVSKITGVVPIRTQAAARQALHDYMQSMDALQRDLDRDYEALVAHRGRLPSHRAVLQLLHDLLAAAKSDGKIVIETASAPKTPAAKKVTKLGRFARIKAAAKLLWSGEVPKPTPTPRKRKVTEAAAPAPTVAANPVAPASTTAPEPAVAAAAATVTVNFHPATASTDVVAEDVSPTGPKPFVVDPSAPDAEVVEPAAAPAAPAATGPADPADLAALADKFKKS